MLLPSSNSLLMQSRDALNPALSIRKKQLSRQFGNIIDYSVPNYDLRSSLNAPSLMDSSSLSTDQPISMTPIQSARRRGENPIGTLQSALRGEYVRDGGIYTNPEMATRFQTHLQNMRNKTSEQRSGLAPMAERRALIQSRAMRIPVERLYQQKALGQILGGGGASGGNSTTGMSDRDYQLAALGGLISPDWWQGTTRRDIMGLEQRGLTEREGMGQKGATERTGMEQGGLTSRARELNDANIKIANLNNDMQKAIAAGDRASAELIAREKNAAELERDKIHAGTAEKIAPVSALGTALSGGNLAPMLEAEQREPGSAAGMFRGLSDVMTGRTSAGETTKPTGIGGIPQPSVNPTTGEVDQEETINRILQYYPNVDTDPAERTAAHRAFAKAGIDPLAAAESMEPYWFLKSLSSFVAPPESKPLYNEVYMSESQKRNYRRLRKLAK